MNKAREDKTDLPVTTFGYTTFYNCRHLLIQLDGKARVILDMICERMDENNMIQIDSMVHQEMCDHIEYVTKQSNWISYSVFRKKLTLLRKTELLVETRVSDLYIVNPKYFEGPGRNAQKIQAYLLKNDPMSNKFTRTYKPRKKLPR